MILVDSHELFLMKVKSQTVTVIKDFIIMVKNQFQKDIKIIKTDNVSEFLGNECQSVLKGFGILH